MPWYWVAALLGTLVLGVNLGVMLMALLSVEDADR
jgi:hypothetical protein